MVTQKDVAELAGVSFITVSRVINGETNVKEETKKKVLSAIDKLGYAPSFAGQVLNSGRCNTIAILTPIPFYISMRSFYLMNVLSGIEEECRRNNMDMMLSIAPEATGSASYDYLRPFKQKKVDGIIYIGLRQIPGDMLNELKKKNFHCVVIGDRPKNKFVSWVDTDNFAAGYDTTKKLWEYGHKRIAFVGLKKEIYNSNITDRENGFVQALKDLGAGYSPEEYIVRSDYDSESLDGEIFTSFSDWKNPPTAIFCCTDTNVPRVVRGLKKAGLKVPKDVSVVGFDGFINETNFYMKIATNIQPFKKMGQEAAKILFAHIKDGELKKQTVVLPVEFTEGESLRKL